MPIADFKAENVEAGDEATPPFIGRYETDLGTFTELNPDSLPSEDLEREWFLAATKKGPVIGALFLFSISFIRCSN